MSGISMHIYAYVRVACVHTRVHSSAHGIRVYVSVCGRDKDMEEEGGRCGAYMSASAGGGMTPLCPQPRRGKGGARLTSPAPLPFLTLSFRNVAKASVTASPPSLTHTLVRFLANSRE